MSTNIPSRIGRYEILELVGRGGMGVLYRAKDPVLERIVALKMMLVDFSRDPAARERFEREAKAVARLQHRNVVTIHELGDADGTPYIVMEFLAGQDLDHLVRGKTLSLVEKLDIVSQLCEGLGYAHEQGIVHRDIKPGNLRVLEDGTVKILDFGIAKFAMSSMTQSGTIMGTVHYMAPEQIMGGAIDGRADLFSAGVLLHELIAGQKPFDGESPTAVVYQIMHVEPPTVTSLLEGLPAEIGDIVSRALQKNPDERYNRASEMASDLQIAKMMADLPAGTDGAAAHPETTTKLFATSMAIRTRVETPGAAAPAANATLAKVPAAPPPTPPAAEPAARSRGPVGAAVAALALIGVGVLWWSGAFGGAPAPAEGGTGTPPATTAAPAAAGAGATVVVGSVPAGARLIVDGSDTGRVTPSPVPAGSRVELQLKGYQPFSATLTAADTKAGTRDVRLVRDAAPVRLRISAGFPFQVLIGGKVVSPASERHELSVAPGAGPVVAQSDDLVLRQTVPVDFGRSQMDVTLPAPGVLAVFARDETCTVLVNDVELGFPPIARKSVAAGAVSVALRCPGGGVETRKVTIASGQTVRVTFSATPAN